MKEKQTITSYNPHRTTTKSSVTQQLQQMSVNEDPQETQLSEATLDRLRGTGHSTLHPSESPSTSQVSVGSFHPTMAAAILQPRHYDLTPIARNTSSYDDEHAYVEHQPEYATLVSPEERQTLRGECFLAMPNNLEDTSTRPAMPPIRVSERVKSAGTLDSPPALKALFREPSVATASSPKPIDFNAVKHYSFTSREQYEQLQRESREANDNSRKNQYQPSRQDEDYQVGSIPEEELNRIFLPRRPRSAEDSTEESHQHHRLDHPLSLDERQLSIPSIRMAHHLNSSIASQTDMTEHTDEEDSILYLKDGDEHSLGSRSFPEEATFSLTQNTTSNETTFRTPLEPSSVFPPRIIADTGMVEDRRKRKLREKEHQVYEWLHSLEADGDILAEAASSKFLTGASVSLPDPSEMRRQISTPAPMSHESRK